MTERQIKLTAVYVVYSFLPPGKHSFSVNTISYKAEDIDKFNFKNLSQWAEAQFNLLQLYKKCEKEKLMNKKLSNMKSTSNETHL